MNLDSRQYLDCTGAGSNKGYAADTKYIALESPSPSIFFQTGQDTAMVVVTERLGIRQGCFLWLVAMKHYMR